MAQNVKVVDPLYESYCLPLDGILEHRYVQRAKGVGLSAIPPQWVRGERLTNTCDPSQFEHGCGVARLALAISAKSRIQTLEFVVAAFLHDISQPAFSHIGEQRMPGYKPFERAAQMVQEESLAALIRKVGANPLGVAAIIKGQGPFGPLLSGALNIDHMDSTLRYAMRYGIIQKHMYHATEIAKAYTRCAHGWALDPSCVEQLENWRYVMERNCGVAYGRQYLGRVALLQKALDAYQAEKGDVVKLLSGTEWTAAERMRNTRSSAPYIKMLDENAPAYHLGDVPAPQLDNRALCQRAAAQVGLAPDTVLAEGTRTARDETITLPLSNGGAFEAKISIPALVRVYATERPPRKPTPQTWCG